MDSTKSYFYPILDKHFLNEKKKGKMLIITVYTYTIVRQSTWSYTVTKV